MSVCIYVCIRAAKEARRKEKEKAKSSGLKSFFSSKKKEEVDLEEDHEDYEEVRTVRHIHLFLLIDCYLSEYLCLGPYPAVDWKAVGGAAARGWSAIVFAHRSNYLFQTDGYGHLN